MMSKTNSLRKLIQTQLLTVSNNVYYAVADAKAGFPHIVFLLESINTGDLSRDDYLLTVDLWERGTGYFDVEERADEVEAMLRTVNLPQEDILPTFYSEDRKTVIDDDKSIKHIQLSFVVQLYTN